jgi:hypothetical protein
MNSEISLNMCQKLQEQSNCGCTQISSVTDDT